MKVAILSDIHGNLEALETVLADIRERDADRIYCLGDIVGYGPFPAECLEKIRQVASGIVSGNHEELVYNFDKHRPRLGPIVIEGTRFTINNLNTEQAEFLKSLPLKIEIPDLDMTLAHGGFSQPHNWVYINTWQEAAKHLALFSSRIGVVGHTHKPFVYGSDEKSFRYLMTDRVVLENDQRFLINVGSVGQPRDGDNRTSYGLFEYNKEEVKFSIVRVPYNIRKTCQAILEVGLPEWLGFVLLRGR